MDHLAVEVRPRRLTVEQQDGFGVTWALVDVVHPKPVGELDVVRTEREPGKVAKAFVGCAEHFHRLSVPHRWRGRARPDGLVV